jgi:copper homeostasis protein
VLEVIVDSVADAREAAAGGADRLEVVRALELGGLTPPLLLVREIAEAVSLPLRVIVRGNAGYATDAEERAALRGDAASLAALGIDGLVIGFSDAGQPRLDDLLDVVGAIGDVRATFHRAFDQLRDPLGAIDVLKNVSPVDRILTSGGDGPPQARCGRLADYQRRAGDRLTIIAGGGVDDVMLAEIARTRCVREVHVGRAAREGGRQEAPVTATAVARIRRILESGD